MVKKSKNQITVVDVGSKTVKSIIAEFDEDGMFNIIGIGKSNSELGMRKGNIVSISNAVEAIRDSVESAMNMATTSVEEVIVSISGDHIKTFNSKASVLINGNVINSSDIDRVLQKSKDSFISQKKEVIHIIPQVFFVDDQKVKDPVNMTGSTLEASVHVALANETNAINLRNCLNEIDLRIKCFVFSPIASSYGVLSETERDINTIIIDIGHGTSTAVAYFDGNIEFSTILPVGGFNITNDLAVTLNIDNKTAEEIKLKYGFSLFDEDDEDRVIELDNYENISESMVSKIIGARVFEIFSYLKDDLEKSEIYKEKAYGKIPLTIVLTGGTARLKNIDVLAKEVFGEKVKIKISYPKYNIRGLVDLVKAPEYATTVGLLHFAKEYCGFSLKDGKLSGNSNILGKFFEAIKKRF